MLINVPDSITLYALSHRQRERDESPLLFSDTTAGGEKLKKVVVKS
jgi:hypothetical protein